MRSGSSCTVKILTMEKKKKKILFVLFLSLLIAGSVIAADTDYSGTWYMHYFSTDGEDMISVSDLGMYSEMTLNEDGTVVMTITNGDEENSAEGTWKAEAEGISATIDGGTQTGVLQDGFLLFDTGDDGMLIFGREEPEPAFELADPDEEAKAEDYEGTWLAYKVGMEEVGHFDWDMVAPELGVDTNEIEIKDGVKKVKTRKLYPGYVVIKMIVNNETWYLVRNTEGVTGFVGHGSDPIPLTKEEIVRMGIEKLKIDLDIEVGDTVRIIGGVFEGQLGIVEAINPEKQIVKTRISMFGRDTPAEIEFSQVSKLK